MIHITPLIIPIAGPLGIHGYGIAIALALVVFILLTYNRVRKYVPLSFDMATSILVRCIIAGLIGGRILHIISASDQYKTFADACAVWSGGLSILGCMIAVSIYLPYTLWKHSIPLGITLDSAALYAPIAHAIGRLGCIWAGCCFGGITDMPWAVTYHGITSGAPIHVMLHPTQLYSSLCFLAIFLVMRYIIARTSKAPGVLACSYLIGMSMERFFLDFVRSDRVFLTESILSLHQWISLALIVGTLMFVFIRYYMFREKHITSSLGARPAFKAQPEIRKTTNPLKEKSATYSKSNTSL